MKHFEAIVVGVGGCGSAVLDQLARRGVSAVGIDRFAPGHDRGSSHGETRIIRLAYFEHPDYVPLLRRAYANWDELAASSGRKLIERCGLLMGGPSDGEVIRGARIAAREHGVPLEPIDRSTLASEFPAFSVPEGLEVAWEPDGGYLHVEECVKAYAARAVDCGAVIDAGQTVASWTASEREVRVETETTTYVAERLVVCPGAWASPLLPDVARRADLHVLRKVLAWYPIRSDARAAPTSTFFFELPHGAYYGFPSLDGETVKVAEHSGGEPLDDPLGVDRGLAETDVRGSERFIREVIPGLFAEPTSHSICMYTMSNDGHFVIDRHPEHANVVFAIGFSGHGFKFMSALGPAVADLALEGTKARELEFLALDRWARRAGQAGG